MEAHLGRAMTDAQELRQALCLRLVGSTGSPTVFPNFGMSALPGSRWHGSASQDDCEFPFGFHGYDCAGGPPRVRCLSSFSGIGGRVGPHELCISLQETSEGHRTLCGTVVLDRCPRALQQGVANRIYEDARAKKLDIVGFPDYSPIIAALQHSAVTDANDNYQVCTRKADRLVILRALAEKWMESEEFGACARALIDEHNASYNGDGEFWAEPEGERRATFFSR